MTSGRWDEFEQLLSVEESLHVIRFNDHKAVWLLHITRNLGQELVRGDTDRRD